MATDISSMLSKNIILVDADYIDKVAFDFTVNFERMLMRQIPKADLALWLDCVALDGGLEPGDNDIQVIFIYGNEEIVNFAPGNVKDEIDGKAFKDNLGEFSMEAYPVESSVSTMGDQFTDTLRVLLDAEKVETIIAVPSMEEYGMKVKEAVKKNKQKQLTLLTIQPQSGLGFSQQQLGFSVVHALGVKGEEFQQMQ